MWQIKGKAYKYRVLYLVSRVLECLHCDDFSRPNCSSFHPVSVPTMVCPKDTAGCALVISYLNHRVKNRKQCISDSDLACFQRMSGAVPSLANCVKGSMDPGNFTKYLKCIEAEPNSNLQEEFMDEVREGHYEPVDIEICLCHQDRCNSVNNFPDYVRLTNDNEYIFEDDATYPRPVSLLIFAFLTLSQLLS